MIKYWIKNRLIYELILAIALSFFLNFVFVYPTNEVCANIQDDNGIYLNSNIDFQIPNPSMEQLNDIKSQSFVKDTFGYYLTKTNVNNHKISLLMSDQMNSLDFTMFNAQTKRDSLSSNNKNIAYIDQIAANKLNAKIGDELTISLAGRNLKYELHSIYKANTLFSEGTVLIDFANDVKQIYDENGLSNNYSGAFISASNILDCQSYLKNYIPLGRLKDRSEFDTDEAYNIYNNAILSGNYANEVTNFSDARSNALNEYENAANKRTMMTYVGAILSGIIYIGVCLILRGRKSEKKYFKSVLKNKKLISKYRIYSLICNIIVFTIVSIILQLAMKFTSFMVVPTMLCIVLFVASYVVNVVLDKKYN